MEQSPQSSEPKPLPEGVNIGIALLLWFFLGFLGAHKFYMGRSRAGITMLCLTIGGAFTTVILIGFVLLIIAFVIWLMDGIKLLMGLGKATGAAS